MNIEDLDDPRARELHKLAHKGMAAAAILFGKYARDAPFSVQTRAHWEFNQALRQHQELLKELEKEEQRLIGGWRNEGE